MSKPAATPPAATTDTTGATEKRWPAIYALVAAGFRPATTAARTNHVRLVDAWLVHLIPIFFALFVVLVIDNANVGRFQPQRPPASEVLLDSAKRLIREAIHDPLDTALPFIILLGPIDIAIFLLAICLMPWGARHEPFVDSLHHALRRTWLHCGHAGMLVALVALIHGILLHVRPEWLRGYTYVDTSTSPSFAFRYAEEIESLAIVLAAAWFAWALFRALGADRPARTPVYVPKCLGCGYNLTGLPPGHRCPECGRPMPVPSANRAEDIPAAQQAAVRDWHRGYWRTTLAWMRHPKALARSLHLNADCQRHKSILIINSVVCGLLVGIGLAVVDYFAGDRDRLGERTAVQFFEFGSQWTVLVVVCNSAAATVAAAMISSRYHRNVLPEVFRVACYSSGWLILWTLLNLGMVAAWRFFLDVGNAPDESVTILILVACAVGIFGNLVRVSVNVRDPNGFDVARS